ncbi:MAG: glycoside hydrolase family 2 protein [bacterium]
MDLPLSVAMNQSRTRQIINLNGIWQAQKRGDKTWKQVLVPGAYDFEGEVEFKRNFVLDSSLVGQPLKLVVFGINNRCTIFINNEFLAGHSGGHTSFTVELDNEILTFGAQNEIRILVDNVLLPRNSLPLKHNPRMVRNYGGIFRDMFILAVPPVYIENLQVRRHFSDDLKNCQLSVNASLKNEIKYGVNIENKKQGIRLSAELWDVDGKQLVSRAISERISFEGMSVQKEITLRVENVKLWSPESPHLYESRAYLTQNNQILDEFRLRIGLKKIQLDGKNFMLNGQPVTLFGMDWYEDFPDLGATVGWKTIKEEILRIKETGANAIRVVGKPPHPYVMDICDEVGMLVFQEAPFCLIPDTRFEDRGFIELTLDYYQEMLERDSNHVSIAGWGLGSDLQFQTTNTQNFLQKLKQKIQESSSVLTYVVVRHSQQNTWPRGADLVFLEFYNKESDEVLAFANKWISKVPEKPFLFSFGYPFIKWEKNTPSSNLKDERRSLSQTSVPVSTEFLQHQAYELQRALMHLELIPKFTGVFIHTYADWTGSQPNLIFGTNENTLINRSGVVDMNREKRLAYDVVESVFKANPTPEIARNQPPTRNPIIYPIGGLALILIFLFNYNRSRRLRGNLRRIFLYPHGFYIELKDNRKISVWHTFLIGLLTCAIWGIILSSIAFKCRQLLIFNEILSLVAGNEFIKQKLIWLIWNPVWFIVIGAGGLYLTFCLWILALKISHFILGRRLPLSQFFTMVFWVSANFLWLLPVTPIYFRIISRPNWTLPALWLLVFFIAWYFARSFRAIKVVYSLSYFKAGILVILLFLILFGGVGWYYHRDYALFDYLPVYWSLVKI